MNAEALNRILYVEDDADIRMVAQMALETVGGFTLGVCSSGAEALARGEDFGPDLLLLDVQMPVMDGPTTLAGLRQIRALATTPAVFMTAKVMPSDVEFYKSLGVLGVIAKPFNPMELGNQVMALWKARDDG